MFFNMLTICENVLFTKYKRNSSVQKSATSFFNFSCKLPIKMVLFEIIVYVRSWIVHCINFVKGSYFAVLIYSSNMWQHLLGCIVPASANNLLHGVKWSSWAKFKFSFSQEKESVKGQWHCWKNKNFTYEKQFYLYRLLFIFSIVSFSVNIKIFFLRSLNK